MNKPHHPEHSHHPAPASIPREDFDLFLHELTHEIRNRLNGISLEATDLAEQVGSPLVAGRLQRRVQDCSAYLKKVREALAPDDPNAEHIPLNDYVKKMRERHEDSHR